jgi:DNA-binding FadR family transcriptional regulator
MTPEAAADITNPDHGQRYDWQTFPQRTMTIQRSTDLPEKTEKVLEEVFFRPAHWHSAYEVAVQRLAQAINLGALKPGARLPPERELVERLGVSRTTLREGMRALQQQGYLATRQGRSGGTFVADHQTRTPSKRDILRVAARIRDELPGLLDLRVAVEPKAAELAALRATDDAIDDLRILVKRGEEAPRAKLRQADSTVHIVIAYAAQSDRLLDLVLEEQMRLHELLGYMAAAPVEPHLRVQHNEIVEAIADRDPVRSYNLMRDHIDLTNTILAELLDLDINPKTARD